MCGCGDRFHVATALDEARSLAAEGKYEAALEKHVWFHDHALDVDKSHYGVRLSFALSDWVALGQKFPKALATLKQIRVEKTSRLLNGEANAALFHDVEAINRYLGDSPATLELFKKIDTTNPEFAATLYPWAEETLVSAKEFQLARKYLGDPSVQFENARSLFQNGLQHVKSLPAGHPSRTAFERLFTDRAVRIIKVLEGSDDSEAAKDIQNKASQILNNPEIQNARNL
jgi:hypothetical protein